MEVLNTLLDLPQMTITAVESNDKEVHIHLVHTTERRRCSQCGQESTELHQNHPRIVRDLPISGKTCYLHFTKRRFFCSQCRRPFSERLDFVDPYRDYTRRYQDYIYRLVRENNISYVERIEGLSYEVVERIFLLEAKDRLPSQPFKDVVRQQVQVRKQRAGLRKIRVPEQIRIHLRGGVGRRRRLGRAGGQRRLSLPPASRRARPGPAHAVDEIVSYDTRRRTYDTILGSYQADAGSKNKG